MDENFTAWLMRDTFGLEDDNPDVPAWHRDAACRDVPTSVFFPDREGDHGEALAICERCPVRQQCLQWAIDHGERYGVWGGLTAGQRQRQAAA